MRISSFTCAAALIASALSSSLPATSNTDVAAFLLQNYGLHVPNPVSIGNVSFTCQILQKLFPRNETFLASSSYYTPLYEIPWCVASSLFQVLVTPVS